MHNQTYIHFGIVIYEMVTGRVPFDADTAVSVALKQVQEKPIPPIEVNKSIPKGLNYIILKAMEKDIKLRYKSAEELLVDLEILIKNPEVDFNNLDEKVKDSITRIIPVVQAKIPKDEKAERESVFIRKPWLKYVIGALVAIIVIIVAMVTTIFLAEKSKKGESYIPNLTGDFGQPRLTKDEAIKELEQRGFQYEIIEEFNKDVEKGSVIKQEPKYQANFKMKTGTLFKVYISKGEEMVVLPKDLIGKQKDEAEEILKKLEIKYEIIEEFNENEKIKKGEVTKLEPNPDEQEKIGKSETLKVTISKGPENPKVKLPEYNELISLDFEAVEKKLKDLKLKVKKQDQINEEFNPGKVIGTNPRPGEEVKEGDTITVIVSKAPENKTITIKINPKKIATKKKKESQPKINLTLTVDNKTILNSREYRTSDEEQIESTQLKYSGYPMSAIVEIDGEYYKELTIDLSKTTEIIID